VRPADFKSAAIPLGEPSGGLNDNGKGGRGQGDVNVGADLQDGPFLYYRTPYVASRDKVAGVVPRGIDLWWDIDVRAGVGYGLDGGTAFVLEGGLKYP
jgi:hypothetical protein